jgi:hypothetical protein
MTYIFVRGEEEREQREFIIHSEDAKKQNKLRGP